MNITIIKEDRYDLPGGDVLISLSDLGNHQEYSHVISPKYPPLMNYFYTDIFGYRYVVTDVIITPDMIKFGEIIIGEGGIMPTDQIQRIQIHPTLIPQWKY
jgi:hypothetical protein